MVRIGDQVHTKTFAYLCVYATITDSVVPYILHRNIVEYLIFRLFFTFYWIFYLPAIRDFSCLLSLLLIYFTDVYCKQYASRS